MIKNIGYSVFSRGIHHAAFIKNIPVEGSMELTRHCNLNCVHCYIRDNSVQDELTGNELFRLLDEITDAGCLWLLMSGGEPLLRDDFRDVYRHAKKKGLLITLFTNGTLIDGELAAFLKAQRPFSVEITLYGASRETYEAVSGVGGSYDACINGIRLLANNGIPPALKTMAMELNKHEIPEMRRFAKSLGLPFRYDPVLSPRLDGSLSPYKVRLPENEVVSLDMCDPERSREWIELYGKYGGPASEEYLFNCGAGRSRFHITSCGKLQVCDLVPEPAYALRHGSFKEGYAMFPPVRERRLGAGRTCAGCADMIFCNSCPGISRLEDGRANGGPVDYHCRVARMRAGHFLEEQRR